MEQEKIKKLKSEIADVLYSSNGTGSGADDVVKYLVKAGYISTTSIKPPERDYGQSDERKAGDIWNEAQKTLLSDLSECFMNNWSRGELRTDQQVFIAIGKWIKTYPLVEYASLHAQKQEAGVSDAVEWPIPGDKEISAAYKQYQLSTIGLPFYENGAFTSGIDFYAKWLREKARGGEG